MMQDVYRRLQEKINGYGPGFPASESGVELKILQIVFTGEDAEFYMKMAQMPETVEMIAGRLSVDAVKTVKQLEHMLNKGTVLCFEKDGRTVYSPAPYIVGLYENITDSMDATTAELLEQYHNEVYFRHLTDAMKVGLRYVPVQKALDVTSQVLPLDDVIKILKSKRKIAVIDCPCRKQLELTGTPTNKPLETCFSFNDYAEYYVEKRKQGRYLTVDEAIAIQNLCDKEGLVTQSSILKDFKIMCHCDKNCIMFRSFGNRIPTEYFVSNYYSQVDPDACAGCGACVERCQTEAISIGEDDLAAVQRDRCIGCGLCVTVCPTKAVALRQKPEKEQLKELMSPEDVKRLIAHPPR
jgi:Na+-translocating ferredoxin:NAD+ oxidoreductase subunit B